MTNAPLVGSRSGNPPLKFLPDRNAIAFDVPKWPRSCGRLTPRKKDDPAQITRFGSRCLPTIRQIGESSAPYAHTVLQVITRASALVVLARNAQTLHFRLKRRAL